MRGQLKGIALLLLSILLMIGFGDETLFDFSLHWSAVFAVLGLVGTVMVFLPEKTDK